MRRTHGRHQRGRVCEVKCSVRALLPFVLVSISLWWLVDTGPLGVVISSTPDPCSLSGELVNGTCVCDFPWRGARCSELAEGPSHPALCEADRRRLGSTWGASVVEWEGSWYMYVSVMANNCSLTAWERQSYIVVAHSTSPLGPYCDAKEVLPRFAHNPSVVRTNDGTLRLYTIGTPVPPSSSCDSSDTLFTKLAVYSGMASDPSTIVRLHEATHPLGPWTERSPSPLVGRRGWVWNRWVSNPNAYYDKATGETWLSHKGKDSTIWTAARLGVTKGHGSSPPYPVLPLVAEDPFLWRSHRGWHMLCHVWREGGSNSDGAVLYSPDGIDWHAATDPPYTGRLASGIFYRYRQRPALIMNSSGTPLALLTGVAGPDKRCSTLITPFTRGS